MTDRIMFDSDTLDRVPKTGASMIAFYVDLVPPMNLKTRVYDNIAEMFPHWSQIPIDRHGLYPAVNRVFDVETGALQASQLETLITAFNEHNVFYHSGGRPIVYCDKSNIESVRIGTGKYVLNRDYYLWVASWGDLYTGEGVIACQNSPHEGYDSSIVFSEQWVPYGPA